jgi:ketol-acid reductoisomerase
MDNFAPVPPAQAVQGAEFAALLLPDEHIPAILAGELAAALSAGTAVVLAHGFAWVYGGLTVPDGVDLLLVSPAAPGAVMRAEFAQGRGVPFYVAAIVDASGQALARAHQYAAALGGGRRGAPVLETDARSETEIDLFGEQAVVVGGVCELAAAAFETMVSAGYDERLAYLEVVHQLKHLVDVIHAEGVDGLLDRISGTALYGALTRGRRVIGESSRREMSTLLGEIRSGAFASELAADAAAGHARRTRLREAMRARGLAEARVRALAQGDPDHPRPGR